MLEGHVTDCDDEPAAAQGKQRPQSPALKLTLSVSSSTGVVSLGVPRDRDLGQWGQDDKMQQLMAAEAARIAEPKLQQSCDFLGTNDQAPGSKTQMAATKSPFARPPSVARLASSTVQSIPLVDAGHCLELDTSPAEVLVDATDQGWMGLEDPPSVDVYNGLLSNMGVGLDDAAIRMPVSQASAGLARDGRIASASTVRVVWSSAPKRNLMPWLRRPSTSSSYQSSYTAGIRPLTDAGTIRDIHSTGRKTPTTPGLVRPAASTQKIPLSLFVQSSANNRVQRTELEEGARNVRPVSHIGFRRSLGTQSPLTANNYPKRRRAQTPSVSGKRIWEIGGWGSKDLSFEASGISCGPDARVIITLSTPQITAQTVAETIKQLEHHNSTISVRMPVANEHTRTLRDSSSDLSFIRSESPFASVQNEWSYVAGVALREYSFLGQRITNGETTKESNNAAELVELKLARLFRKALPGSHTCKSVQIAAKKDAGLRRGKIASKHKAFSGGVYGFLNCHDVAQMVESEISNLIPPDMLMASSTSLAPSSTTSLYSPATTTSLFSPAIPLHALECDTHESVNREETPEIFEERSIRLDDSKFCRGASRGALTRSGWDDAEMLDKASCASSPPASYTHVPGRALHCALHTDVIPPSLSPFRVLLLRGGHGSMSKIDLGGGSIVNLIGAAGFQTSGGLSPLQMSKAMVAQQQRAALGSMVREHVCLYTHKHTHTYTHKHTHTHTHAYTRSQEQ